MNSRKAGEKGIPRLLALLGQVLQIYAEIRPDIFIPGTTKYTAGELAELLKQEDKPIYVAVNKEDVCMGYAFCQLKKQPFSTNMVPFESLFIDDLCVCQNVIGVFLDIRRSSHDGFLRAENRCCGMGIYLLCIVTAENLQSCGSKQNTDCE